MSTQKLTFSVNPLVVIIALLVSIIAMIAIWQPWQGSKTEQRTIAITGVGEVSATPDEFMFSPYYERSGNDAAKMKEELAAYGNTLLEAVVKLGVDRSDVTLDSNNFTSGAAEPANPGIRPVPAKESVTLHVQIKTTSKEIAQKVQNYLATTDAKGTLTPQPTFSKQKRQQLEGDARQKATKDAREKADKTAKDLGATVGKVIKVSDKTAGSIIPMNAYSAGDSATPETSASLPVTPGKNDVSIRMEVTFELK